MYAYAGATKPCGLDPGELEHAPPGVEGADRLAPRRGRRTRPARCGAGGAACQRRCATGVLEAVLRDRVACALALDQPLAILRATVRQRMQVARGDHEQGHAVDAEIV